MFKEILDVWGKTGLLQEAFDSGKGVLERDKAMFLAATASLLKGTPAQLNVFLEDKKINQQHQEIKKKVFEYLALTSAPDLFAALVLNDTIDNFERIGDYCKDIMDLKTVYGGNVPKKYLKDFTELKQQLLQLFDLTEKIVYSTDSGGAEDALLLYNKIKKRCKEIKMECYSSGSLSNKESLSSVSLCRFYRRIGAHLSNVCRTVLQPFPVPEE